MSAPFVSGVAGLVLSLNPSYTPQQVKNAIFELGQPPQDLAGGFTVTSGRLNAQGALTGSTANATPRTDGIMAGAVTINSRKHGSLSFPTDINDIYKKRLRAGKSYAVLLDVPRRADYDVFVWKPGAADTWPVDYGCGGFSCLFQKAGVKGRGKDEYLEFTARKTGTYYFHVTSSAAEDRTPCGWECPRGNLTGPRALYRHPPVRLVMRMVARVVLAARVEKGTDPMRRMVTVGVVAVAVSHAHHHCERDHLRRARRQRASEGRRAARAGRVFRRHLGDVLRDAHLADRLPDRGPLRPGRQRVAVTFDRRTTRRSGKTYWGTWHADPG